MTGYDVQLLTPSGMRTIHHAGRMETEPGWLILSDGDGDHPGRPVAAYPSHAVVGVELCEGGCSDG